ncbi:unnamed protein product [Onchocerca ochengi]|uniref:ATP-dependent DNA helicase n=1 Tax=Onchocerca ochengi TaxID=42157 RepID=A0A182DZS7_ONCOC|nr:unnamed protein product [Onchocerca ochengi]
MEVNRTESSEEETGSDSDSHLEKSIIYGDSAIYSIENTALDTRMALRNVLNCPAKYISKQVPLLALKNYCFVINGDLLDVQRTMDNSKLWWKSTSSRVRYYSSKELQTFHEVDALLCRGELRCAYLRRNRASSIEQIPLEKIFRVSREYSHWKTCIGFHRIISCVSPVTKSAVEFYGFQKRIFMQYLWRSAKYEEKRRVAREYQISTTPFKVKMNRLRRSSLVAASVDAPGGIGKTFLIRLILATVRSQNCVALVLAWSRISATLLPVGRTAHSVLKSPLSTRFIEASTCSISKASVTSKEELVEEIFPDFQINQKNHDWLCERAVLAARKKTDVVVYIAVENRYANYHVTKHQLAKTL